MTWLLTFGMWSHVYLTASALVPRLRTRNPIWGELATVGLLLPLFVLWGLIAEVTS